MAVERVAVLSDIHGVLPALEAVLAESDVRATDRIVVNGDIASGPQPVETLGVEQKVARLRENAAAFVRRVVRPAA